MNGAQTLVESFAGSRLVRPSAEALNFMDLVRAMLRLAGGEGVAGGPGVEELCRKIGPADHYVFVLVDGMGARLLEKLPAAGFLRGHLAGTLQAIFPSTTASALVSLATGAWPADHGVPGWWVYLEGRGLTATALWFCERFSECPLGEFGVAAEEVFPVASVWAGIGHEPLSVLGSAIADSTFSTYARGGTARAAYRDVGDAVEIVAGHVRQAERQILTYLYLPQFDAICHKEGTESPRALALLEGLEAHLRSLADEIAGRARIVITADHGLINTSPERTFILEHDDPIVSHLLCPPTGEPTMPYFHVKPGHERALVDSFTRRFGDAFVFLTPDEAEDMHLFGPGPLSPVTRRRLGDFIAIAPRPAALYFRPRQGAFHLHAAVHAGLTPEEMLVPLILV